MRESLRDDSSEKDILNGVRDLGTTQQNAVPGKFLGCIQDKAILISMSVCCKDV